MCRHFKHLFLLLGMLGCGSAKDGASVSPSSDTATATANDSAAPPSDPDVECIPELSADHPAPEFSAVFLETCAGCHGADGLGQGAYPSMKGLSLEGFMNTVRSGLVGDTVLDNMPAFDATRITDSQLMSDYAALTGQGIKMPDGCEPFAAQSPEPTEWSVELIDAAKEAGLSAWRTPDHEGAACANCHGPAPYGIANIGYRDGDILRRAMLHVDSERTWAVVDWVAALRAEMDLEKTALPDPMIFRPLQPGGIVIDGATPAERDHAFGQQLAAAAPTLAGPPIHDAATAQQAVAEYLAIDARTFPIGIQFNRYTEDGHHGTEHASLREWLPDHAIVGVDEAAQDAIYATHDAWIADPSWDNFLMMENIIDRSQYGVGDWSDEQTSVPTAASSEPTNLARQQYRSVLLFQHLMRAQAEQGVRYEDLPSTPSYRINGPWKAADEFRTHSDGCWYSPDDCGDDYDPVMASKLDFTGKVDWDGDPWDISSEKEDFILSWFWAGFTVDNGLLMTCCGNSTKSTEYLTGRLYARGMYNHLTFLRFKKNLAVGFEDSYPGDCVEGAPGEPTICYDFQHSRPEPQTIVSPYAQNWNYFLGYGKGLGHKTPDDPAAKDLYQLLLANSFRMMAYTIISHIESTGWADGVRDNGNRDVAGFGLRSLADSYVPFFNDYHGVSMDDPAALTGEAAADAHMLELMTQRLHEACELGYPGYGADPWPGHCDYSEDLP